MRLSTPIMELMKTNKFILCLILFVLTLSTAFAQDSDIFAPFVSKVRFATKDNLVKITWTDSPDINGLIRIFAHDTAINKNNFSEAREIAQVEPGIESYIFQPETTDPIYYLVLQEDEEGKLYEVFIPYRNSSANPIRVAFLEAPKGYEINNFITRAVEDYIEIDFELTGDTGNILLFRSTKPFATERDIMQATEIGSYKKPEPPLKDSPIAGISFYYLAIDEATYKSGDFAIQAGTNTSVSYAMIPLGDTPAVVNTTPEEPEVATVNEEPEISEPESDTTEDEVVILPVEPVTTSEVLATIGTIESENFRRPMPLPFLRRADEVTGSGYTGSSLFGGLVSQPDVSEATDKAIANLLSIFETETPALLKSHILPIDKMEARNGIESSLKDIVQTSFSAGDWVLATKQIEEFLKLNISTEVRGRAFYYLAQCAYFTNNYRESFMYFLSVDTDTKEYTGPWLDSLLEILAFFKQ